MKKIIANYVLPLTEDAMYGGEYHDWCEEQCKDDWYWADLPHGFFICFVHEEDAMAYRLRFGNDQKLRRR